jgi:hypothetical protein
MNYKTIKRFVNARQSIKNVLKHTNSAKLERMLEAVDARIAELRLERRYYN